MTPDFLVRVNKTYRPKTNYDDLCKKHASLISEIESYLIDVSTKLPELNSKVLTIQDLSSIGKGVFVDTHFYTKHGFVANITDDDPYGYITRWCSLPDNIINI